MGIRTKSLLRAASLLLAFAGTGAVGCAVAPKPPPTQAVTQQAPAVSWDGTYRGSVQITALGSSIQRSWCETDPQMTVQVVGNAFSYAMPHPNSPGNPTPVYSGSIGQDGRFIAQRGSGTMAGTIVGDRMEGGIDGSVCVYSFSLTRS